VATTTVIETFRNGLVTSRDPSTLRSGELQRTDDCIYHPNDPAIWKAPGRNEYNSSAIVGATTEVKGLRYLEFDDSDTAGAANFLIAHVDDGGTQSYFESVFDNETETSFVSFDTNVGDGETLESIQYNNRFYMLNGNADGIANRVLGTDDTTPTSRRHGLEPVIDPPTVATNPGAGWPGVDKGFGDDNYFFFTTEVINPIRGDENEDIITDEVESTFTGTPAIHDISGTANGVTVTAPATFTNSSATHWRIYMHGPTKADEWGGVMFSDSWQVSENIPVATTAVNLGNVTSSQTQNTMTTSELVAGWATRTNAEACDKTGATTSTKGASFDCKNFGFNTGGITGTITGIRINIKSKKAGAGRAEVDVAVSKNDGGAYISSQLDGPFVNHYENVFFGGPEDLWGTTWTAAEMGNGFFAVRITYQNQVLNFSPIDLDCVEVTVFFGGANEIVRKKQFDAICVQVSSLIVCQGANGAPPVSSTGDIFEGQMVLNDVEDASIIRYSLPDNVDAFPSIYFLNFETKDNDSVSYIRRLGNKLIVGTKHKMFRVNYLPRSTDAEFDRGRSYEEISSDHGVMSVQGASLFTPPDRPQILAYVSENGLHATDGYHTSTLTEDIDWPNTVNTQLLDSCILVNYPKYSSLVFYYIPADDTTSTKPTRALWLNYHPSQIKEGGKLKVSGPQFASNTAREIGSATTGRLSNETILLTGLDNGVVYVEDREFDDGASDATGGINPDIATRSIYGAGVGSEFNVERMWVRHYEHDTSTVTMLPYYQNVNGELTTPTPGATWTAKTFTTAAGSILPGALSTLQNNGALERMDLHLTGENFVFRFQEADGGFGMALSYMGLSVKGQGLEETR